MMPTVRRLLALALIAIASCSTTHVVTTPGSTGHSQPPQPARVGDTITLHGNEQGLAVAVTVLQLIDPAHAGQLGPPPPSKRLVAVQVRLRNVGAATYDDSPGNGARLKDQAGQEYSAQIEDSTSCQGFANGTATIAAGDEAVGCVTFELPKAAMVASFQFRLDSGFGPDVGQWQI
ncbi:MAG TPA: DUF4352 domain-containing protein [Actinomycetota bacterium]|nr:DUF4352 domain-containing protein [Actinomycetota bacterium]